MTKTEEAKQQHNEYMRNYAASRPKYRLFQTWRLIVRRCNDKRHKNYERYGARGIKLCDAWTDYEVFWQWAQSNGYVPGLQIDRINNDGPYAPENCRFTTSKNNNRNRSNNKLDVEKVRKIRELCDGGASDAEVAKLFGVDRALIYRIRKKQQWV